MKAGKREEEGEQENFKNKSFEWKLWRIRCAMYGQKSLSLSVAFAENKAFSLKKDIKRNY